MQAIYKPDINLNNHQYSNHTPKFSLNKRVWPTKLLIIKCRCGCQIACGQGRENYYITSDGLRKKNDKLLLFRNLILTCTITLHACFWYQYMGNSLEIMSMQVRIFTRLLALRYIGFCNVLCIWSVRAIPTYRVYRLYDTASLEILPAENFCLFHTRALIGYPKIFFQFIFKRQAFY